MIFQRAGGTYTLLCFASRFTILPAIAFAWQVPDRWILLSPRTKQWDGQQVLSCFVGPNCWILLGITNTAVCLLSLQLPLDCNQSMPRWLAQRDSTAAAYASEKTCMGASKHAVNPLSLSLRVVEDSGINVLFSLVDFLGVTPPLKVCPTQSMHRPYLGQIFNKYFNIFKQILRPFHAANLRSPLCISRRFDPLVHGPWRDERYERPVQLCW